MVQVKEEQDSKYVSVLDPVSVDSDSEVTLTKVIDVDAALLHQHQCSQTPSSIASITSSGTAANKMSKLNTVINVSGVKIFPGKTSCSAISG